MPFSERSGETGAKQIRPTPVRNPNGARPSKEGQEKSNRSPLARRDWKQVRQ